MIRLAILLSGRGSNFGAIHDAIAAGALEASVVAVISNRPDAPGLARARELGYPAHALDHKQFSDRAAHEAAVLSVLEEAGPDFIVLAGYMRLLSSGFVSRYPNRILNIHPSLLPSYPGVDAQEQALAHGAKVSGCTVHFVDEHLDAGPILVQRCVPVREDDDAAALSARILEQEHAAYVEALVKLSEGPCRVDGRRVVFASCKPPGNCVSS
jgi:phosphoribosylglycinamide formyltransferase-1